MLSTLMIKEIHETVITYRFQITFFLCLILIPLVMYVSLKDHERQNEEYQNSMRLYQENSRERINSEFQAEEFRSPSLLSVFSRRAEYSVPFKVTKLRNSDFQISPKMPEKNLLVDLFGKIDFAVIVSYMLSIMAIIFTFKCNAGEKKNETLRMMIANSTPHRKVLLKKIIRTFLNLLLPLLIAWLIVLMVLFWWGKFQIITVDRFLLILFISIIFLFIISNIGVFIYIRMNHSVTSMIVLLLIWVLMIFVVPILSSLVAKKLFIP